jgi:hypothetical protein
MKLNRFVALALIAAIAVATLSFFSMRALAQTADPATPAQDCANDGDGNEAANEGEDQDNVQEECGPQDEQENDANEANDANDANEANEASGTEGAEDQAEGPDMPLTGTVLEQASAAALAYLGEGQVTGSEVGDEEGYYEIEVTLADGHQVDVHLDENFNVLNQAGDSGR